MVVLLLVGMQIDSRALEEATEDGSCLKLQKKNQAHRLWIWQIRNLSFILWETNLGICLRVCTVLFVASVFKWAIDSNLDLPIPLRKDKHTCTYPISSFVSYNIYLLLLGVFLLSRFRTVVRLCPILLEVLLWKRKWKPYMLTVHGYA